MLQWTPDMVQLVLELAEMLNEAIFPFSIIIPVVTILIFIFLMFHATKNPGSRSSAYLKGFLGIVYIYSGCTILPMVSSGEVAFAVVGAVALWMIGVLLFLDILWSKTVFDFALGNHNEFKVIGLILIFSGIFIYPLLEIATGHMWPSMVLFTAECPTTISLIGLYLTALPKTNKLILAIISLNAMYTGFSVALAGFLPDALYGVAGVFGTLALILYWSEIKFLPLRELVE